MPSTKKSKKQKVRSSDNFMLHRELSQLDYNQALDFSYVLMDTYISQLEKCEVIQRQKQIQDQFLKVQEEMMKLYQMVGDKACEVKS
jgi:hypothetical protein